MALEKISVCPICNSSSLAEHLTTKDYTTSQEEFSIVTCTTCELGITTARPTADTIGPYYVSEKYISHTGGSQSLSDILYRQARSYMHAEKRKVIERFSSTGHIIDYGCGTGEFLKYMHSHRWKVTGIEPSDTARTKAALLNPDSIYALLGDAPSTDATAITLWHVAEHLHELNLVIDQLKKRLLPKGTFFIAVPNYQSPDSKLYHKYWAGYDVPRHLWHFSKKSMHQLMQNHGMKIVDIQPMILDAFYISFISEQYRNPTLSKIQALTNGFRMGWKSNRLAKAQMNYSSLLYIAQQ